MRVYKKIDPEFLKKSRKKNIKLHMLIQNEYL